MPICLISAMAACADGYTAPSRRTEATTGTAARSSGLPARSTRTSRSTRDGSSCAQVMAMAAPAAGAAVTRATGVTIGKRQLEELARRAAAHVEAFYMFRVISPVPDNWPLVLTFDGKGIVMLPGALRPATAKAAAAAEGKLATRLSPGEKNGRKRMAELACVFAAVPVPRTPEDIISTPAQKRKKRRRRRRPANRRRRGRASRGSRRREASG